MQNVSKKPCPVVIVVDDDSGVRNSLKFSLKVEGFAVSAYGCAGDLLDSLDPLECACFVIDQNMPGMKGLDLITKLRERRISTSAILITGDPSAAVIDRAKRADIRIVEKPFLNPALVDGIRAARIVLPSPDTIERVGLAGRARARKLAADTLIAPLTAEQITGLDALLVNDPASKRSPLAWLRDVPEAPGANNLNEMIERLTYVRKIRLDPKLADSIHEHRFRQLVREGAVAPSSLVLAHGQGPIGIGHEEQRAISPKRR